MGKVARSTRPQREGWSPAYGRGRLSSGQDEGHGAGMEQGLTVGNLEKEAVGLMGQVREQATVGARWEMF